VPSSTLHWLPGESLLNRTEKEEKKEKKQRKIAALKERRRDKGLKKGPVDPKDFFFLWLSSELKRSQLLTKPLAF